MKKLIFLEVSILSAILYFGLLNAASASDDLRVISIDGSITEIIYALEMEDTLVGIDTTSRYPKQTESIAKIGYMRQLSAEGILSLNPNLVIATESAGPSEVLDQLQRAGLNLHVIDNSASIDGVFKKVKTVSELLGVPEKGEKLIQELSKNVKQLKQQLATQTWESPPKVMFLLAAGNHGVMLAGKDTQADAMIRLMGGSNVVQQFSSFKPLTPEGALQTLPDIIVIADTKSGSEVLNSFELLKHTPAVKNNRVIQADSMLLLGFGPRIDQAISAMAPAFYVTR